MLQDNRVNESDHGSTVLLKEELDVCQMLLGRSKLTRLLNGHLLHLLGTDQKDGLIRALVKFLSKDGQPIRLNLRQWAKFKTHSIYVPQFTTYFHLLWRWLRLLSLSSVDNLDAQRGGVIRRHLIQCTSTDPCVKAI
jgi:hypothetical protein